MPKISVILPHQILSGWRKVLEAETGYSDAALRNGIEIERL